MFSIIILCTKMPKTCIQYLPKYGRKCKHRVENGYRKCYQHRNYKFPKPNECPICVSTLPGWCIPLRPCNHWVCWDCIIKSGKELCPLCRANIDVPQKHMIMLQFYGEQLKRHIEDSSLELIFSERLRLQIRNLLDQLLHQDAVSSSEISGEEDKNELI